MPVEGERPTVGIALSGGGARGIAHIGVLKALEELNVPVDYVAGASMGSVVGGLYASGLRVTTVETTFEQIDWPSLFETQVSRDVMQYRDKREDRQFIAGLEFGLGRDSISPAGFLAGENLMLMLREATSHVVAEDFSQLPIPFVAVATDINAAQPYELKEGDFALALRASMAIPAVFSPVEVDGRHLVDGGILNNLPTDVVKAMGADFVIAVNISSPLAKLRDDASLFTIAYQSIDAALVANTFKSLASADLVITPDLGDLSAADFQKVQQFVELGYQATMAKAQLLKSLALPQDAYQQWRMARIAPDNIGVPEQIGSIIVSGAERTDARRIQAKLNDLVGQPADPVSITEAVNDVRSLGGFEAVSYRRVRTDDGLLGLQLDVDEKPWGPHYLRVGFRIESDFDLEPKVALGVRHRRRNLNALGGEWINDVVIGSELLLATELFQPVNFEQSWFVSPYFRLHRRSEDFFLDNDDVIARYRRTDFGAGFDIGLEHLSWELRAGLWRGRSDGTRRIGIPQFPDFNDDEASLRVRLGVDTMNRSVLATKGQDITVEHEQFFADLGSESNYSYSRINGRWRLPVGRSSAVVLQGRAEWVEGDLPPSGYVTLGGLDTLSGFAEEALIGERSLFFAGGMLFPLKSLETPLEGPRFVALAHFGEVWRGNESIDLDDLRPGLTAGISWDLLNTLLFVGAGYTQGGDGRFYLRLGNQF